SAGILICRSGIGNSMVANKIPGIRAALCCNRRAARLSREHNDANILALGADFINKSEVNQIVNTWLTTDFQGGRHNRRVNQISKIEKMVFKKS
ncbi:MAG: RpiB/LacA/LacB family sugar-phosphate isomerase, partial [Candidatus Omnitrophota bacterium]